jgi:hypothetical protein
MKMHGGLITEPPDIRSIKDLVGVEAKKIITTFTENRTPVVQPEVSHPLD